MGFYYFDFSYFLFMLPAIIFTMIAQIFVRRSFSKYSRVPSMRGLTGAQAADTVARGGGAYGIAIRPVAGSLTDCFDPRDRSISLSRDVYSSSSIAAIGVAAHEAGHAVQNATGYMPNKIRTALVPVTNFGSRLSMPLIIIGLLLPTRFDFLVYAGIIMYSLVVLFELVTLPVEINASRRAIRALGESQILYEDELHGAKTVLTAAAMTYLAASFTALLNILRLVFIANSRRSDN